MTSMITKFELVDRDMLECLLLQEETIVSTENKKKLEKIKRELNLINGRPNTLKIDYNFSKGYENLKVGRIYPSSVSLGTQDADVIRNPLTYKNYWDIDMENCHFTIALKYAKDNKLPCQNLQDYVENRNEWLKNINDNRWKAKTLLLKLGYGGCIPYTYDEYKNLELDTNECNIEMLPKIQGIQQEMRTIAFYCYEEHKDWHDLSTKTKFKPTKLKNRDNKEFVLLSLYLQTEERKLLLLMDEFFTQKMRSVDRLIHDGIHIRKNIDEKEFNKELLTECENYLKLKSNYHIKISQKPIEMKLNIKQIVKEEFNVYSSVEYIETKKIVESNHFCYRGEFLIESLNEVGSLSFSRIKKVEDYLEKYQIPNYNKNGDLVMMSFYPIWLKDKTRREYTKFDFITDGNCPKDTYNYFRGFKYQEYFTENESYELTNEELIIWDKSLIKKQIESYLCNDRQDCQEYFYQYLALMCFNPDKPANKCLTLRNEIGGTGKSAFFEMFFNPKILGLDYCAVSSDTEKFFNSFDNDIISHKILCYVEEGDTKDTKVLANKIKSAITKKVNIIRSLYTSGIEEKNRINWIISTNKETAIVFEPKNMRRFPYIDCKEHRLDSFEKRQLSIESECPIIAKIFTKILKKKYNKEFDFENHPYSETYNTLEKKYADIFSQFFNYIITEYTKDDDFKYNQQLIDYNGTLVNSTILSSKQFYELFKNICGEYYGRHYYEMTLSQFIHHKELKYWRENYKEAMNYEPSTNVGGSKYILNFKEIRKIIQFKFKI